MKHSLVTALTLGLLLAGTAHAQSLQSHASIRTAAGQFARAAVLASNGIEPTVKVSELDSRLRLVRCQQPLEAFQPVGGKLLGNITVGVRCTGSRPWSLYVPVRVSLFAEVVVAARPLARNSALAQTDLKLERRDLARLHNGYFTDPAALVGKKLTRPVPLNAALTDSQIREPLAVRRGQRVTLVATGSGIEVRMGGEALADGAAGDRIRVRNSSSRRVVDGIVQDAGTVQVAM